MYFPVLIVTILVIGGFLLLIGLFFAAKYADQKICGKCRSNKTKLRVERTLRHEDEVGGFLFISPFMYCTEHKDCSSCNHTVQKKWWTEEPTREALQAFNKNLTSANGISQVKP